MTKWNTALLALALTGAFAGSAMAAVTVVRGDTAEVVKTDRAGPVVLRGGNTMRAVGPQEKETKSVRRVVAGDTLWLVDDDGVPSAACFLARTGYVGGWQIRCTEPQ